MSKFKLSHPALCYAEDETTETGYSGNHDGSDYIMVEGKMVVCPTCQGTGMMERQDLDMSRMVDNMREDGDDEGLERYFSGAFDVVCSHCNGSNVVLEPVWESVPKWAIDEMEAWDRSERESQRISDQERRMGA